MTTHWKQYDDWLHKLVSLADESGVELELGKYSYHTYFMRGWLPESVVADIKEREE